MSAPKAQVTQLNDPEGPITLKAAEGFSLSVFFKIVGSSDDKSIYHYWVALADDTSITTNNDDKVTVRVDVPAPLVSQISKQFFEDCLLSFFKSPGGPLPGGPPILRP